MWLQLTEIQKTFCLRMCMWEAADGEKYTSQTTMQSTFKGIQDCQVCHGENMDIGNFHFQSLHCFAF